MPAPRRLCVVLVDPHAFTRECICDLMRSDRLQVIGLADVEQAATAGPMVDAVIIRLKAIAPHDHRVLSDLHDLRQIWPRAPLLALVPLDCAEAGFEAVQIGFSGCLSPAMTGDEMVAALQLVIAGGIFVGPARSGGTGRSMAATFPPQDTTPALTPRESDVLEMLRQGKPNKMIAYELEMAENTVKVHVGRILKKLGVGNRTALANLDPESVRRRSSSRGRPPRLH